MIPDIVLAAIDRDIFVGMGLVVAGFVFCLGRRILGGVIYQGKVYSNPRYPYSHADVARSFVVMGCALIACGVAVLVNVAVRYW